MHGGQREFYEEERRKGGLDGAYNKALWGMLHCMNFAQKCKYGCLAPGRNIFSLFATVVAWMDVDGVIELGFPTFET